MKEFANEGIIVNPSVNENDALPEFNSQLEPISRNNSQAIDQADELNLGYNEPMTDMEPV